MIKVLVAALLGTIIGIVIMVAVIAIAGTDTSGSSSVGLGISLSTFSGSSSAPATSPPPSSSGGGSSGGGTSTGGGVTGDATAGKTVWADNGCGSCHTLAAAGSAGTVGPDLDKAITADAGSIPLPDFVKESIIDPNKVIASGFSANIMPGDFGTKLSSTDIDDLVALILQGK
jgi:cytochrome c551/c552